MRREKHLSESTRIGEGVGADMTLPATAKPYSSAPDLPTAKSNDPQLTSLVGNGSFADRIKADLAQTQPAGLVSAVSHTIAPAKNNFPGGRVEPPKVGSASLAPILAKKLALPNADRASDRIDCVRTSAPPANDRLAKTPTSNDRLASDPPAETSPVGVTSNALVTPALARFVDSPGIAKPISPLPSGELRSDHLRHDLAISAASGLPHPSPKQRLAEASVSPLDVPTAAAPAPGPALTTAIATSAVLPPADAGNLSLPQEKTGEAFTTRTSVTKPQGKTPTKPIVDSHLGVSGAAAEPSLSNGVPRAAGVQVAAVTALQATTLLASPRSSEGAQHLGTAAIGSAAVHAIPPTWGASADPRKATEFLLPAAASAGEPTPKFGAQTLIATPHVVEIGVANDTHGWLRVRAELTKSGELNGVVLTNSTTGASALRGELTAMSTFLQGEAIGLKSLVIQATAASHGLQSGEQSAASGGQPRQAGNQEEQANARAQTNAAMGELQNPGAWSVADTGFGRTPGPALDLASGLGGWLSVRV